MTLDSELQSWVLFIMAIGTTLATVVAAWTNLNNKVSKNTDGIGNLVIIVKGLSDDSDKRSKSIHQIKESMIRQESTLKVFGSEIEGKLNSIELRLKSYMDLTEKEFEPIKKKLDQL